MAPKPFYPSNVLPPLSRFRDLVIFEDRLKQNYASLTRIRQRHRAFMLVLGCFTVIYLIFCGLSPSTSQLLPPPVEHFVSVLFLLALLGLAGLIYLWYFNDKIQHANKFERQIKKDLELYNMTFTGSRPDPLGYARRIPKRWQDIFFLYRDEYRRRRIMALQRFPM